MKKMKVLLTAIVASLMMMLSAVGVMADDDVRPTSVYFTSKTKTVYAGKDFELKVKMRPTDADEDELRWKIYGNKGIVKFDDDDLTDDEIELKALKPGTVTVRCWIKGTSKKANIKVVVKKAPVKLAIDGTSRPKVEVGDEIDLEVKTSGISSKDLKWTITNTKIVKFDDDRVGKEIEVKGVKPGKTKVTCLHKPSGKKVTFLVQVVPNDDADDDNDDDNNDDSNDDNDDN